MALEITPADATLSATVRGVDLGDLDDATFREIEATWHEYGVLIFPGQNLSDEAHLAFTRRFGPLEQSIRRNRATGISNLSNVQSDGTVAPSSSLQARFLICDTPNADGGAAWGYVRAWHESGRLGRDAHVVFTGHMTAHARGICSCLLLHI